MDLFQQEDRFFSMDDLSRWLNRDSVELRQRSQMRTIIVGLQGTDLSIRTVALRAGDYCTTCGGA